MNQIARDAVALLDDMLTEIRYLEEMIQAHEVDDLEDDGSLRRGLERALEILGEAAKAMPKDVQARYPELPWSEMAKTRDLIAHAYHRVEPAIVWATAKEHATPLAGAIEDALEAEGSGDQ